MLRIKKIMSLLKSGIYMEKKYNSHEFIIHNLYFTIYYVEDLYNNISQIEIRI